MSTKAVIGWLIVAVVLGLGVVFALRGGGAGDGPAAGTRVVSFSPSAVRRVSIGPSGTGDPDVLERTDAASGEWLLKLGGKGAAWPVPGAQADNLLALMTEATSVAIPQCEAQLGSVPTVVTLERSDGGPITVRFAERSIGGTGLIEVVTRGDGAGETVTRAMVNDRLHQIVRDRNVRNWRARAAMPWARADIARVRLERGEQTLALARTAGRWSLREPVASPADQEAVQRLIGTLAAVEIVEFVDDGAPGVPTGLDEPHARVLVEIDRNDVANATDRPAVETTRHTLDVGSPADTSRERFFVRIDGERLAKVAGLSRLTIDPAAYLSASPTPLPAASVGMVVLERLDANGVPTDDGRVLKRSLDRWVEIADGAEPRALTEEELKDVQAVLGFLSTDDASAASRPEVRMTPPEAYRAGARVSLRSLDDAPLAEVEIGMSTVSALAAVRSGDVYRVYPLDRLPRLVARVMQASPAINPPPPPGTETTPDQNK